MSYKVPFVDYPKHYQALQPELGNLVNEVIFERSDFILRGDLTDFETNAAKFLGVNYAVGMKSCTDALILGLRAAGIGPGDEVITVSHTFLATIAAIHHCGAKPVLVDIREDDDLMDVALAEAAITSKTKAILPVHLNGRICDMAHIEALAKKHNLVIFEDSAQALGATFDGRKGGSFGIAASFSFYPAKLLGAAGDGGLLSTNDQKMHDTIRLLRDHGRVGKNNDFACFGFNSRLDNLQAAILNFKLTRHFAAWLERRRAVARIYQERLAGLPIKLPIAPVENDLRYDVYQNYPISSPERDQLVPFLTERGIETIVSWRKPAHFNESLELNFSLPVTEKLCREVVSLPMNTEVTDEQVHYVCDTISEYFSKSSRQPYQSIRSAVS